jgi:hypothetical protein
MKYPAIAATLSLTALTIACLSGDPVKSASIATQIVKSVDSLFQGGSNSVIAVAIGNAEGTRTVNGSPTSAYYGHTDPGNAKRNIGTFSYQHCPATCSPTIADSLQLKRLKEQTDTIKSLAKSKAVPLDKAALVNGIDLANQAPLAALASGGYIDRLREAHKQGLTGSAAVLWARAHSYFDPDLGRWNAPGLGNNLAQIQADQKRRQMAIEKVLDLPTN